MKRCFLLIGFLLTNLIHGQMIINSYAYAAPPVGTELYTWSDAASPIGVVEADFIDEGLDTSDKWRLRFNTGEIAGVGKADTTIAYTGDYCIKLIATNTTGSLSHLYSPEAYALTIGGTYRFSFYAKTVAPTAKYATSAGWTTSSGILDLITDGLWHYYQIEGTVTAAQADILIYTTRTSGTIGDVVYVDNASILEL